MPRATVLIGTWNNAPTLGRAIDSILAQTLSDLELIVVDDGSTDQTAAIVERYAAEDPRVRNLALPHLGIAASLNRGVEAAASEVVALQDADDYSLPDRVRRQLDVLEGDPSVAVVGCHMREVDEQGRELRPRLPRASGDVRPTLLRYNPIPGTCSCFRRSVFLATGGFDLSYRYAPDYELWLRIGDRHRLICIAEELAVRTMSSKAAGAVHERAQLAEIVKAQVATMVRRRTLSGATHLARPALSWIAPLRLKRRIRAARGVAP